MYIYRIFHCSRPISASKLDKLSGSKHKAMVTTTSWLALQMGDRNQNRFRSSAKHVPHGSSINRNNICDSCCPFWYSWSCLYIPHFAAFPLSTQAATPDTNKVQVARTNYNTFLIILPFSRSKSMGCRYRPTTDTFRWLLSDKRHAFRALRAIECRACRIQLKDITPISRWDC